MRIEVLKELDDELIVHKESSLKEILKIAPTKAPVKGALCFIKNARFLKDLATYENRDQLILLVNEKTASLMSESIHEYSGVYQTSNLMEMMCSLSKVFYDEKYSGLNYLLDGRQLNTANIDPSAEIAQQVFVGDGVVIEAGARIHSGSRILPFSHIGRNTEVYPNVTLYPFSQVGKDCRIHSNTTIGSDGFGYQFLNGKHEKIWHMGSVIIENQVEVGANCSIDSGTFSPTRIGTGTKIDNQVQIGHNVEMGQNVVICGGVAIGGSCIIKDFCVVGGSSAFAPSVELGMGTQAAGGSMITKSWPQGSKIGGFPAVEIKEWISSIRFIRKGVKK